MIVEVGIGQERPHRYPVRRDGDRIVLKRLDNAEEDGHGHETAIDWRRPRPGLYSLLVDGASYEVFVEEDSDHLSVHLVKRTFRVRAADVRRHRKSAETGTARDGLVRITAPIPGRVSRVLVSAGEHISRGDGIVVVEAMKMENELRSPRDGVVGSIDVEQGQGVEGGALLATIE